eukprot:COSAG03_NODE_1085_length_4856_cov_3.198444_5_plen_204_part_00
MPESGAGPNCAVYPPALARAPSGIVPVAVVAGPPPSLVLFTRLPSAVQAATLGCACPFANSQGHPGPGRGCCGLPSAQREPCMGSCLGGCGGPAALLCFGHSLPLLHRMRRERRTSCNKRLPFTTLCHHSHLGATSQPPWRHDQPATLAPPASHIGATSQPPWRHDQPHWRHRPVVIGATGGPYGAVCGGFRWSSAETATNGG